MRIVKASELELANRLNRIEAALLELADMIESGEYLYAKKIIYDLYINPKNHE